MKTQGHCPFHFLYWINLSDSIQYITSGRLHSELRRVLELQQKTSKVQRQHATIPKAHQPAALQEVLDAMQQEKDQYVEMWQRCSEQLRQLQTAHEGCIQELSVKSAELQETREDVARYQSQWREASTIKQQLESECHRCISTAQAQAEEIDNLKNELRHCKTDLKTVNLKLSESKQIAEEVQDKLHSKERETRQFAELEQSLQGNINQLENEVSTLESRLLLVQKESRSLHAEKSELEMMCLDLQKKVNSFKQQEQEVVTHVRDAMQLVESALLERDQAVVREKQRGKEVARLQKAMTHLMDQTGEKTKEEVTAVREQCNKNISKLIEELRQLELDLAEKQNMLERAQREKKTVEKELEKVLQERPGDSFRHSDILQQLQSRVCVAERARNELQLKLDAVTSQCRQKEISWGQERIHSESHVADLERRLHSREHECEQLQEEAIKLQGDLDAMNKRVKSTEQARQTAERKLMQEVASLQQLQALKEKEFSHRLENTGDAHRQNTQELRQLLMTQRQMGAKWREESKVLTSKFEQTVKEMTAEINKLKKRNGELMLQIEAARSSQQESEMQIGELQAVESRLNRLLHEAESRAETANEQVATLLSREHQLLDERKALHREVDRMHMQSIHKNRRPHASKQLGYNGTDLIGGFRHSSHQRPIHSTHINLDDDPRLVDFDLPTQSPGLHLEDLTNPGDRHRL
jgi:chromosome segregation ATPase